MCCDAFSRQAIVSSMYTVHMLGAGWGIAHIHTHTETYMLEHKHTLTHTSYQSLGGYKAVAYSKNPPIRAVVYCHPLGRGGRRERGRERVCGWLAVIVVVGRMQVIVRMLI